MQNKVTWLSAELPQTTSGQMRFPSAGAGHYIFITNVPCLDGRYRVNDILETSSWPAAMRSLDLIPVISRIPPKLMSLLDPYYYILLYNIIHYYMVEFLLRGGRYDLRNVRTLM